MAIHDLATNLDLHLLDEEVTETATSTRSPEHVVSSIRGRLACVGQSHLEVGAEHEIGVTVHHHDGALSVGGRTCEVHAHRLHREIGMALVEHLPKRDVRVSGDICILSTICDELEKTTAHCVYLLRGYILLRLNNEGTLGRQVLSLRQEGQEDL